MRKLIYLAAVSLISFTGFAQDLVSGGSNSWVFHTPDDGRAELVIAPKTNGNWDWNMSSVFHNDGRLAVQQFEVWRDSKLNGHTESVGDIIFGGGNSWILHHPTSPTSDARNLHFAPKIDGQWSWGKQIYFTKDADVIVDGKIGIGTRNPDSKLTVKGSVHCEEVKVDLNVPADYVFEKYYEGASTLKEDYTMPTLEEVEAFTKKNHHLPSVPSAKTIQEEGLHLKEMTNLLLQKVEELTLYTIEQEKRIKTLEAKLTQKN